MPESCSILPINVHDLLTFSGIESARVEFKESWNAEFTGYQVLKTICAFANDLHNPNGGYIVLGVKEIGGCAILPPQGLSPHEIDKAQKWIRGKCNLIEPAYTPLMSPEEIDSKKILVIWAPGSDNRAHSCPEKERERKKYWVRIGSETVDAKRQGVLTDLLQLSAKIPFDDRRSMGSRIEDIDELRVREFLKEIRSGLCDFKNPMEIYRSLRLVQRVNAHEIPRNDRAPLLL